MPFYNYKCDACGHEFEALNSMSNRKVPELEDCPKCKETEVKLTVSTPHIITDSMRL